MDKQSGLTKGGTSSLAEPRDDNLLRCIISPGLGRSLGAWEVNEKSLDPTREGDLSHQRAGIISSRDGNQNIFKGTTCANNSHLFGQHDSTFLLDSQGGTKNETLTKIAKRI